MLLLSLRWLGRSLGRLLWVVLVPGTSVIRVRRIFQLLLCPDAALACLSAKSQREEMSCVFFLGMRRVLFLSGCRFGLDRLAHTRSCLHLADAMCGKLMSGEKATVAEGLRRIFQFPFSVMS